jgi:RNA polymerase sigma factor (sigma-70 family)
MNPMATTTPTSLSDGELLAQFAVRREEESFSELVLRHGGMVLSVCRAVLHNTTDAEDAAQAVFITLARKAQSPSVQSHLVGWLHRVAWYVATRAAEARGVRRRHEERAARMRPECGSLTDESLPQEALHAALASVPESYRVPMILYHLEGRSHQETAALVGCSVEAVAVRLHRGREMLRKKLVRRGVPVTTALLLGLWATPAMAEVPPAFVANTTGAAIHVLSGTVAPAALATATSMALSQSAMSMLYWAKVKTASVILAALLVAGGLVLVGLRPADRDTTLTSAATPTATTPITAPPGDNPPPAAKPPPLPGTFLTGVIHRIRADSITLVRRGGVHVDVPINADTAFQVDDKPAQRADLRAGMRCAMFMVNTRPAHEVRAYSPANGEPGVKDN